MSTLKRACFSHFLALVPRDGAKEFAGEYWPDPLRSCGPIIGVRSEHPRCPALRWRTPATGCPTPSSHARSRSAGWLTGTDRRPARTGSRRASPSLWNANEGPLGVQRIDECLYGQPYPVGPQRNGASEQSRERNVDRTGRQARLSRSTPDAVSTLERIHGESKLRPNVVGISPTAPPSVAAVAVAILAGAPWLTGVTECTGTRDNEIFRVAVGWRNAQCFKNGGNVAPADPNRCRWERGWQSAHADGAALTARTARSVRSGPVSLLHAACPPPTTAVPLAADRVAGGRRVGLGPNWSIRLRRAALLRR